MKKTNYTEADWSVTSKSKKSYDIGRIKMNLKILSLSVPMSKINDVISELSVKISEVLEKHHKENEDLQKSNTQG